MYYIHCYHYHYSNMINMTAPTKTKDCQHGTSTSQDTHLPAVLAQRASPMFRIWCRSAGEE